jgi:hypothetical protein
MFDYGITNSIISKLQGFAFLIREIFGLSASSRGGTESMVSIRRITAITHVYQGR